MKYRHEWKHEINYCDMLVLRQRLSAVAKRDPHSVDGKYLIRSLYFDNVSDKALREKINGVNIREKFRIRYYNNDASLIHLEKKCKVNGLCLKESATLSTQQARAIAKGDYEWMIKSEMRRITNMLVQKFQKRDLGRRFLIRFGLVGLFV